MNEAWRKENPWAEKLAKSRDERICESVSFSNGSDPQTMKTLRIWALTRLREVAASGVQADGLLKITDESAKIDALVCGVRKGPRFQRQDGLLCNFKIVARQSKSGLELLSYSFQMDAPPDVDAMPRFLRFDFSQAAKSERGQVFEPKAHIHPGHEDVRLPGPVLSPRELILSFLSIEPWW